jgi:serine/threonine-protein kinase
LRFFASLMSGALAVFLLFLQLPLMLGAARVGLRAIIIFGTYSASLALFVVLAWVLWGGRPISLGRIRGLELAFFGIYMAIAVEWHYGFFAWLWVRGNDPVLLAAGESLPWVFLIMGYGTFIPNTWRRCALFVGIMAAVPLALNAADAFSPRGASANALRYFFLVMSAWLALAVAIAVYGSFRVELLRQEAYQARRLGQYQLRQRLGAGGMGEVYLAEHMLLRRPCAIKLIRPDQAGDPRVLARFEREVRATATLTHPNTVQVFDYGHAEDGTFYYVMEYLPGPTLQQLVQQYGPLPSRRAIHFLCQLCGALREAHSTGLIHRDIKPSNIIVCQRGDLYDTAKLLDFGLVLPPRDSPDGEKLTKEGAVAGTPAYMSPEQAGGQEDVDARSDIYSVGALAYFLLTGQPPFADRSIVRTLAAHLYEPPAPLTRYRPDVPGDLQAVVLRCLAKSPAERYADAESLEAALTGCTTAGTWSAREATHWWRCQAAPSGGDDSKGASHECSLTRRCT